MGTKTRRKPATRRKAVAKKSAPRRRRSVATVAKKTRRRVSARYTKGGKANLQQIAIDAAATIAGAVAAGMAGQALAKAGVDSRISGVIPAAAGVLLALKGKGGLMKAVGIGMVVTAGINVVNNLTKAASGLSGDASGLDSIDLYREPNLLGIPVMPDMMGVPMMAGVGINAGASAPVWQTSCSL